MPGRSACPLLLLSLPQGKAIQRLPLKEGTKIKLSSCPQNCWQAWKTANHGLCLRPVDFPLQRGVSNKEESLFLMYEVAVVIPVFQTGIFWRPLARHGSQQDAWGHRSPWITILENSFQQILKPDTLKHAVERQHTPGVSIESIAIR